MERPYCVVLTGGIGSGKSLVAAAFARLGADVVDTDVIARELTAPGSPLIARLAERFGNAILDREGNLDRVALRARVFADPARRRELEEILHPLIRERAGQMVRDSRATYVLLVVPLLVESGAYWGLADRVLVVDCEPEVQIERIMLRDGIGRGLAESMLAAQAGRQERLARADDVIDNGRAGTDIGAEVSRLHAGYLGRASAA